MSPVDVCTITSTRGTRLLSRVVLSQQPAGVVRPQTAPTTQIPVSAFAGTSDRRGRVLPCDAQPSATFDQGGAVAAIGAAPVTDLMVTDHPYSTRLGPLSCRPPV